MKIFVLFGRILILPDFGVTFIFYDDDKSRSKYSKKICFFPFWDCHLMNSSWQPNNRRSSPSIREPKENESVYFYGIDKFRPHFIRAKKRRISKKISNEKKEKKIYLNENFFLLLTTTPK